MLWELKGSGIAAAGVGDNVRAIEMALADQLAPGARFSEGHRPGWVGGIDGGDGQTGATKADVGLPMAIGGR